MTPSNMQFVIFKTAPKPIKVISWNYYYFKDTFTIVYCICISAQAHLELAKVSVNIFYALGQVQSALLLFFVE